MIRNEELLRKFETYEKVREYVMVIRGNLSELFKLANELEDDFEFYGMLKRLEELLDKIEDKCDKRQYDIGVQLIMANNGKCPKCGHDTWKCYYDNGDRGCKDSEQLLKYFKEWIWYICSIHCTKCYWGFKLKGCD